MDATVGRSGVAGRARAPASKSYTHRAILSGGYARRSRIDGPLLSADPRATIRAVEAFGGHVDVGEDALTVTGFDGRPEAPSEPIDCANSGTTLRLATATAALADGVTELTGDASLRSRPQGPLLQAIDALGGRAESLEATGQAPLVVEGPIHGGRVAIPGDVSSQFVTALLMAGAATDDGVEVALETPLKSAPYVEITREVLAEFGVVTRRTGGGFAVAGDQSYELAADAYPVPGDFSSVGYLLAAGAIAGEDPVSVEGAHPSAQGDAAIVDVLERMGATIEWYRETGQGMGAVLNIADEQGVSPSTVRKRLGHLEDVGVAALDVVGFYHSHPRGPPRPSETDARLAAWPGHSYVIVSLAGDEATLGSWRWTGEAFDAEPVEIRTPEE
jgi:3-phosphoshikimate 1-carboxyvinyltransferase